MIEIRKISSKNQEDISDLSITIKKCFLDCYLKILPEEQLSYIFNFIQPKILMEEISNDGYEYYFIEVDNVKVGFFELFKEMDSIEVKRLYLSDEFKYQGIGVDVFNEIKSIAKQQNARTIKLYVNQKLTNSIEIFKKLNFKIIKPSAIYIGSDYFLYDYLMEYSVN